MSLPNRGPLEIFSVSVGKGSAADVTRILKAAGFETTARDVKKRLDEVGAEAVAAILSVAEEVAIDNCPKDTGELAYQHIETEIDADGLSGRVVVDSRQHYGRRNHPETASSLAELLNIGRSTPFKTAKLKNDEDWIKRAIREFKSKGLADLGRSRSLRKLFKRG